jgi:hypothetical protein
LVLSVIVVGESLGNIGSSVDALKLQYSSPGLNRGNFGADRDLVTDREHYAIFVVRHFPSLGWTLDTPRPTPENSCSGADRVQIVGM